MALKGLSRETALTHNCVTHCERTQRILDVTSMRGQCLLGSDGWGKGVKRVHNGHARHARRNTSGVLRIPPRGLAAVLELHEAILACTLCRALFRRELQLSLSLKTAPCPSRLAKKNCLPKRWGWSLCFRERLTHSPCHT